MRMMNEELSDFRLDTGCDRPGRENEKSRVPGCESSKGLQGSAKQMFQDLPVLFPWTSPGYCIGLSREKMMMAALKRYGSICMRSIEYVANGKIPATPENFSWAEKNPVTGHPGKYRQVFISMIRITSRQQRFGNTGTRRGSRIFRRAAFSHRRSSSRVQSGRPSHLPSPPAGREP